MKNILEVMQWLFEHFQNSMQFLILLVSVFPFVVVIVLTGLLLGMIPSPLIETSKHLLNDKKTAQEQHLRLTDSVIKLNQVAVEYYDLLKIHSREAKRKEQLIQYLVLESCRRDNKGDQSKCERLEQTLRELEP